MLHGDLHPGNILVQDRSWLPADQRPAAARAARSAKLAGIDGDGASGEAGGEAGGGGRRGGACSFWRQSCTAASVPLHAILSACAVRWRAHGHMGVICRVGEYRVASSVACSSLFTGPSAPMGPVYLLLSAAAEGTSGGLSRLFGGAAEEDLTVVFLDAGLAIDLDDYAHRNMVQTRTRKPPDTHANAVGGTSAQVTSAPRRGFSSTTAKKELGMAEETNTQQYVLLIFLGASCPSACSTPPRPHVLLSSQVQILRAFTDNDGRRAARLAVAASDRAAALEALARERAADLDETLTAALAAWWAEVRFFLFPSSFCHGS